MLIFGPSDRQDKILRCQRRVVSNCYNPATVLNPGSNSSETLALHSTEKPLSRTGAGRGLGGVWDLRAYGGSKEHMLYQCAQHFQLALFLQHTIMCFRPQGGTGKDKKRPLDISLARPKLLPGREW